MSGVAPPSSQVDPPRRGMRYENLYVWLVFLAALDVMLTWIVLYRGGREANALAAFVIGRFGLGGMVVFKFLIIVLVILICEAIGRRKPEAGRRFARGAVAIHLVPLTLAALLLLTRL